MNNHAKSSKIIRNHNDENVAYVCGGESMLLHALPLNGDASHTFPMGEVMLENVQTKRPRMRIACVA